MAGYLIARIEVTDPEKYKEYVARTPKSIADAGGKFVVRGGKTLTMEGDDETRRIVVLEFETPEAAKAWYHSADYEEIRKLRFASAKSEIVIVDGA